MPGQLGFCLTTGGPNPKQAKKETVGWMMADWPTGTVCNPTNFQPKVKACTCIFMSSQFNEWKLISIQIYHRAVQPAQEGDPLYKKRLKRYGMVKVLTQLLAGSLLIFQFAQPGLIMI